MNRFIHIRTKLILCTLLLSFLVVPSLQANECNSLESRRRNVELQIAKNVESVFGQDVGRAVGETLAATGSAEQACRCAAVRLGVYKPAKFIADMVNILKEQVGSRIYRRLILDPFRHLNAHGGEFFRKYWSGKQMDKENFRWDVVERMYKKGTDLQSFGHQIYEGAVKVLSPLIFKPGLLGGIRDQRAEIGNHPDVKVPMEHSAVPSVSGMSFPQLSAQSVISLLYMNASLAGKGIRYAVNTGEGGPGFHLALINGNREWLKQLTIDHAVQSGRMKRDSIDHAKVDSLVDRFFSQRDKIFSELTQEQIDGIQIVAQFGSALNGIRGKDFHIDYNKLHEIGKHPNVRMIQYKLKQAAKRGSKVKKAKIDEVTAALRDIEPGKEFKSPAVNPDMASVQDIAIMIRSTRAITGKPVSIKFGIGQTKDMFEVLRELKELDALPDHIQLDGGGPNWSSGSGAAGAQADTSLSSRRAVIALDAMLKKLKIREEVYVEVSGDVLVPNEGVEMLALGADGISAARLWLGMGLACAKMKDCASGRCMYGVTATTGSLYSFGLNPSVVGPKGAKAAEAWYEGYTQAISETGAGDWRTFRKTQGLATGAPNLRKHDGRDFVKLDRIHTRKDMADDLEGVMTSREVGQIVYGDN